MLRTTFYQQSLLDVDPDEIGLEKNAFERGLRKLIPKLVSLEDFRDFHASAMGAPSCCPLVLTAMLLLQFRYNLPDERLIAQCRRDLAFRFALGLPKGMSPPRVSSFRRFRAWIRDTKGPDWLFRLSLKLPQEAGLIDDAALQCIDSTNTDCRGAVIDTFNLVGTAIGRVIRSVAHCLGCAPEVLAKRWDLLKYLARSVKGEAGIDWSNVAVRHAFLTAEIRDADRLAQLVSELGLVFPKAIQEALALLAKVARQDVEELPDGTFGIAQRTAPGRIISITDPEARHGRKSASKTITGFKTHVIGTIASQFVTGISVSEASTHDSRPTTQLIGQTVAVGLKPRQVLGDGAYSAGANMRACAQVGVEIRTKLPSASHTGFTKRDFQVDLDTHAVTCPAGHRSTTHSFVKDSEGSEQQVALFRFAPTLCRTCPLQEKCGKTAHLGRRIRLSAYEPEMQRLQRFNADPASKELLRKRSSVERLISHLVRMGMRQARFFGMHRVEFQAFMTAAAYNIQRMFTLSASA